MSFVVPAYNEEAYVGECIESILRETAGLEDVTEIIVVNNASTDNTRAVAGRYPRIHIVDEPRKGLTHARQAGFLASTGTLVANVDSDSRLPFGWVQRVLQEFRRDSALVALSGPLHYYDLTPKQRKAVWVFYGLAWTTYAVNRYLLRVGSMVQGGNFVVSRKAMEEIGGFNLGISFYGEDTDVARRMHQVGKVLFTFDLKMHSSARRLKHEGMLTMAAKYSVNYFWTTFFKRPFTAEHIDVREATKVPLRSEWSGLEIFRDQLQ